MKSLTRLVLVAAAFSVFAASSFSALAEDKKGGKAPAGQVGGKGGAKDLAAKGLGGKDAGGTGPAAYVDVPVSTSSGWPSACSRQPSVSA